MTTGVCKRYPLPIVAPVPPFEAYAGSILRLLPVERPGQDDSRRRPAGTSVVGWPASNLSEAEPCVEGAGRRIVLGDLEQQTLAVDPAQAVDDPCQRPTGNAAAAELRQDGQRQYLRFRPDGKGDHESNGLIADSSQDTETAGHGQNLCYRRLVPGAVETAGMQGGRYRQIERPERLQQQIVGGGAQRFKTPMLVAAAGDDRTSGARKYSGAGGGPVRSATDRAASRATQKASAGPSTVE